MRWQKDAFDVWAFSLAAILLVATAVWLWLVLPVLVLMRAAALWL